MIPGAQRYAGFYKVETVTSLKSFVVNFSGSTIGLSQSSVSSPIYKLVSLKLDRASDISAVTPPNGWMDGNKAWVLNNVIQRTLKSKKNIFA
jgi:hypothetical protein